MTTRTGCRKTSLRLPDRADPSIHDVNELNPGRTPRGRPGNCVSHVPQPPASSSGPRKLGTTPWNGGARRDRTDDLLLAKQALSQLSYGPARARARMAQVVGRGRLELPTSRLSGVRSNHLSYRPDNQHLKPARARPRGTGGAALSRNWRKRNEDGGIPRLFWRPFLTGRTMFQETRIGGSVCERQAPERAILRKEVIQPQVPLRLPCYDFTPVADLTVVGCLPCGLAHHLRVKPTPMV